MVEPSAGDLTALLHACVLGDRLARQALRDWLEEHNDLRHGAVEAEALDWSAVADEALDGLTLVGHGQEWERCRYLVECAREGAVSTPSAVQRAVKEARRRWLRELFPEAF